jgi:hypothetical protein
MANSKQPHRKKPRGEDTLASFCSLFRAFSCPNTCGSHNAREPLIFSIQVEHLGQTAGLRAAAVHLKSKGRMSDIGSNFYCHSHCISNYRILSSITTCSIQHYSTSDSRDYEYYESSIISS